MICSWAMLMLVGSLVIVSQAQAWAPSNTDPLFPGQGVIVYNPTSQTQALLNKLNFLKTLTRRPTSFTPTIPISYPGPITPTFPIGNNSSLTPPSSNVNYVINQDFEGDYQKNHRYYFPAWNGVYNVSYINPNDKFVSLGLGQTAYQNTEIDGGTYNLTFMAGTTDSNTQLTVSLNGRSIQVINDLPFLGFKKYTTTFARYWPETAKLQFTNTGTPSRDGSNNIQLDKVRLTYKKF